MTETDPDLLMRVYARAAKVVLTRGFDPVYTYHRGAPVDLPKALGQAGREVKYPSSMRDPAEYLFEWTGKPLSAWSSKMADQDEAVEFFSDAASSVEEIMAGEKRDPEPEPEEPADEDV